VSEERRANVINAFAFTDGKPDLDLANQGVDAAASATAPTDEPAPTLKVDHGPTLRKVAAAALVVAVIALGILWQSTADQLATSRRLVAAQTGQLAAQSSQINQFRQTASDSVDKLADAIVKLNSARQPNSRNTRENVSDALDTVTTLHKTLKSVP
jgi:hypothetical protein